MKDLLLAGDPLGDPLTFLIWSSIRPTNSFSTRSLSSYICSGDASFLSNVSTATSRRAGSALLKLHLSCSAAIYKVVECKSVAICPIFPCRISLYFSHLRAQRAAACKQAEQAEFHEGRYFWTALRHT